MSHLFDAINSNNINLIKSLVKNNEIDINEIDSFGNSPLIIAIYKKHIEIAKLLISNNANTEIKNKHGQNAIFYSVLINSTELFNILLNSNNVDLNIKDEFGRTLFSLAQNNKNNVILEILKSYNNPKSSIINSDLTPSEKFSNKISSKSKTIISAGHESIDFSKQDRTPNIQPIIQMKITEPIIDNKNINKSDDTVIIGNFIAESDVNINTTDYNSSESQNSLSHIEENNAVNSLSNDSQINNINETNMIIEQHTPFDVINSDIVNNQSNNVTKVTNIDADALINQPTNNITIESLIINQSKENPPTNTLINFTNTNSRTDSITEEKTEATEKNTNNYEVNIIKFVLNNQIDKIKSLIKNNGNIDYLDDTNNNALNWAIIKNNGEIAELLIENNIDTKIKNNQGYTALHLSALHNLPKILKMLLEKGCDPKTQDSLGRTPLDIAEINNFYEIVLLLKPIDEYVLNDTIKINGDKISPVPPSTLSTDYTNEKSTTQNHVNSFSPNLNQEIFHDNISNNKLTSESKSIFYFLEKNYNIDSTIALQAIILIFISIIALLSRSVLFSILGIISIIIFIYTYIWFKNKNMIYYNYDFEINKEKLINIICNYSKVKHYKLLFLDDHEIIIHRTLFGKTEPFPTYINITFLENSVDNYSSIKIGIRSIGNEIIAYQNLIKYININSNNENLIYFNNENTNKKHKTFCCFCGDKIKNLNQCIKCNNYYIYSFIWSFFFVIIIFNSSISFNVSVPFNSEYNGYEKFKFGMTIEDVKKIVNLTKPGLDLYQETQLAVVYYNNKDFDNAVPNPLSYENNVEHYEWIESEKATEKYLFCFINNKLVMIEKKMQRFNVNLYEKLTGKYGYAPLIRTNDRYFNLAAWKNNNQRIVLYIDYVGFESVCYIDYKWYVNIVTIMKNKIEYKIKDI